MLHLAHQTKMTKRIPPQIPIKANGVKKKGKRSSKKTAITLPILPQDVIFFSIFIHLPAQFLLLLRCLSRSSLLQIDNSHFARNHADLASPRLLFFAFNHFHHAEATLLALQINRGQHCRNRITAHQNFKLGNLIAHSILASCNGLLLLRIAGPETRGVVIANPVRKQWRMLPQPLRFSDPRWQSLYGFVFDTSSNQYKVVHLLHGGAGSLLCEVLTLGLLNEGWRLINAPIPTRPAAVISANCRPIRINQILYWVDGHCKKWPTTTVFDPSEHYIMSMDVGKEEFRRIRPPNDAKGLCRLLELGGYLAVLCFDESMVDIWVLQDYDGEVWVQKHDTRNKSLVKHLGFHGWGKHFELSASLHDDKVIVFRSWKKLFKYDLELDCFAEVKTHYAYLGKTLKNAIISSPCVHVDTLIWPL